MIAFHDAIRKAAASSLTVLIQGESGTGKGMAARAIHAGGKRAAEPFVVVNCGALPENLIESELFGHERGAFTGAERLRKGKFEAAGAGTIFLDEVGELPLFAQTRLLHVLQDREFERIGGEGRRIRMEARVIAATNRNLEEAVAQGRFREDLYFRLNVLYIRAPRLRDRPEDIPALAHYFAVSCGAGTDRQALGVSDEAIEVLQRHPWPGNVRQLENIVQRAVAMGETEYVLRRDLPTAFLLDTLPAPQVKVRRFYEAMDETARDACIAAFQASDGNCVVAAQLLGLHRNSVYRLIRRYGLQHLLENTPARPPAGR
jgi:transcriptional regulator with PAS, ATPase and Fis domain